MAAKNARNSQIQPLAAVLSAGDIVDKAPPAAGLLGASVGGPAKKSATNSVATALARKMPGAAPMPPVGFGAMPGGRPSPPPVAAPKARARRPAKSA